MTKDNTNTDTRVDKFLWCIRAYKSRSMGTTDCNNGKITVNNLVVKASKKINIGDIITYKQNPINKTVKVIDIPPSRVGAKLVPNYIEDLTSDEEYEKLEMYQLQQKMWHSQNRDIKKPSKKDRRDLEKFLNNYR
ncbi:MAG: RNA-binding S4 domain-containing protein [Bacteroidales bacterium]|jgi:ribosome-associated heat shock protein Hsp15